jgi:hypothetical protein
LGLGVWGSRGFRFGVLRVQVEVEGVGWLTWIARSKSDARERTAVCMMSPVAWFRVQGSGVRLRVQGVGVGAEPLPLGAAYPGRLGVSVGCVK